MFTVAQAFGPSAPSPRSEPAGRPSAEDGGFDVALADAAATPDQPAPAALRQAAAKDPSREPSEVGSVSGTEQRALAAPDPQAKLPRQAAPALGDSGRAPAAQGAAGSGPVAVPSAGGIAAQTPAQAQDRRFETPSLRAIKAQAALQPADSQNAPGAPLGTQPSTTPSAGAATRPAKTALKLAAPAVNDAQDQAEETLTVSDQLTAMAGQAAIFGQATPATTAAKVQSFAAGGKAVDAAVANDPALTRPAKTSASASAALPPVADVATPDGAQTARLKPGNGTETPVTTTAGLVPVTTAEPAAEISAAQALSASSPRSSAPTLAGPQKSGKASSAIDASGSARVAVSIGDPVGTGTLPAASPALTTLMIAQLPDEDGGSELEGDLPGLGNPVSADPGPMQAPFETVMHASTTAGTAQASTASSQTATSVPLDQLGATVSRAAAAGVSRIDITLAPEELGRVNVSLQFDSAGGASAHFTAERPETLSLLRQDQGALVQAIRDAGFEPASTSVSFDLSSGSQSFAQNQSGDSSGSGAAAWSAYGGRTSSLSDSADGADLSPITPARNALKLYDLSV